MKVKNKIIAMICIIMFFIICYSSKSSAVSAKLSASSTNVVVGTPITINVNISGAAWSINVSGAVNGSYVDNTEDAENTNITKTLSFTPNKAGSYVVKLSGNVTGSSDISATTVSDSITINVKEKEATSTQNTTTATNITTTNSNATTNNNTSTTTIVTNKTPETKPVETKKSSNANIAALWITPKEYDFTGSKASVLVYNTKVPYEVEEITIGGRTQDSKAKFTSGIGKQKLQVGNNSVKVEVTAEDGNKKIYTINVTREEKKVEEDNKTEDTNATPEEANTTESENIEEANKENQVKESDLVKLEVKGFKISPEYSPDIYEYKINVDNSIGSLEVITEKKDDSVSVEIVGNTELKEGENVITILVHNETTSKNSTYQIIVDKLSEIDLNGLNEILNNETKNAEKNKKIIFGVIIGVGVLIVIFIIVKAIYNSQEDDEEEEDEDDENENQHDKVNLEEDEQFFKRIDRNEKKENNVEIEEENDEKEETSITKQRKKGKHF